MPPGRIGSGGITARILDLGIRWRWVVSFTPRPLYPQEKGPWYPLDRRLGVPHSRSGSGGEEKNPLPGFEHPIIQPVAQRYTTELSRLLSLKYHRTKSIPSCSRSPVFINSIHVVFSRHLTCSNPFNSSTSVSHLFRSSCLNSYIWRRIVKFSFRPLLFILILFSLAHFNV
jgi:hypothetical protein